MTKWTDGSVVSRRMGELELGTVAAANDAWAGQAPEGSEVVETAEYRLVRLPEHSAARCRWGRSGLRGRPTPCCGTLPRGRRVRRAGA